MKIALLGYGVQAKAAFEYWNKPENSITICDVKTDIEVPEGVETQLGPDYLKNLERFDVLVRIPSLHPRDLVAATKDHPEVLQRVTTVTNEFLRVCPTENVIGVTGTKGKGTTSTLIARILEANGKTVHLGGNIGTPPLDLLKDNIKPNDWVVLELANFQLIDLKYSPHIAVCLMVVPEHQDWHADMDEYIAAKQQLFAHQTADDIAIYFSDNENSQKVVSVSDGQKIPYFAEPGALVKNNEITIAGHTVCKTSELKLLGQHNWQNVCAAATAVWQVSPDIDRLRSVIINFAGLPHRLEFVRELAGIKFFNDSFASTPDAGVAAIEAIPGMKVMIMGGFERSLPLENFAHDVAKNAGQLRKVVLIGESAERTAAAFTYAGFTNFVISTEKNLAAIVHQAKDLAQSGDSVVLSPGFASFDMFKNFEERGNQYKQAVQTL